ncbi:putative sucrose-phosphate synthase 5 [Dichanthelium oligosanthes]|uniref:Putative sucrose-phosphate synthase 5 n=1 Tax=Dichanthelium oligosanthes TaxID=888268 RepID=A0A1E5VWC4_9POAL|nr:putative sucrose-phosphate synthase 5 [Dichanthelium oligosanthes]
MDAAPPAPVLRPAGQLRRSDGRCRSTCCRRSTGMTVPEAADALRACGADPVAFDVLLYSSSVEACYPWKEFAADEEYSGDVSFRWPGEHVRAAMPRLGKG